MMWFAYLHYVPSLTTVLLSAPPGHCCLGAIAVQQIRPLHVDLRYLS